MSSEFPTALALSYLIKNWMDSSDKLGALTACQLPSWLGGLSLGGLLGIVHAFGSRASAYEPCSSWLTKRTARTSYWAQVADRAIDRLRATASGDVVEWKKLEPLVSKTLIEQVAFQSVDQGEQQVLRYLMGALYGEVLAGHMMGKLPEFSQIDFGWPHV